MTVPYTNEGYAARQLLTMHAPSPDGQITPVQPALFRQKTGLWLPPGGTTITGIGMSIPQSTGTATARVPGSTNMSDSLRRLGVVSAAGAGSAASLRCQELQFWRGNAADLGGFFASFIFNISDAALVATANMFVGFQDTVNAQADAVPSGIANILGVGCDNGDTHLQLYASGAAAQARADLGASFPVNTTNVDVYQLLLYALPNGSAVNYQVNRLNTGATTSGTISTAAKLMTNTVFTGANFQRSNGGTATAVGIDIVSCVIDTNF